VKIRNGQINDPKRSIGRGDGDWRLAPAQNDGRFGRDDVLPVRLSP